MSENVGASTSGNPKGLYGLYRITLPLPNEEIEFTLHLFYILTVMKKYVNGR
jgi:hypothetical protein